jgi:hypothetical protein
MVIHNSRPPLQERVDAIADKAKRGIVTLAGGYAVGHEVVHMVTQEPVKAAVSLGVVVLAGSAMFQGISRS